MTHYPLTRTTTGDYAYRGAVIRWSDPFWSVGRLRFRELRGAVAHIDAAAALARD